MAVLSTFINAKTHDYELQDGNIVFSNELATEIYTRIVTPLGSYPFDITFGSELATWINRRQSLTAAKVTTAINNALKPTLEQGRALSIATKVNSIGLGFVIFTVKVTDINNKTFEFTIPFTNTGK